MNKLCLIALGTAGFSGSVWAHSGHGVTSSANLLHPLVEPVHGIPLLLIVVSILWVRKRLRQQPARSSVNL